MATKKFFLLLILFALAIRIYGIFLAYHGDLNNNISWGDELVRRGTVDFYESGQVNDQRWPYSEPNQPPLYIFLFGFLSLIWQKIYSYSLHLNNLISFFPSGFIWFWEIKGAMFLAKIPSLIADFLIALLVLDYFNRKGKKSIGRVMACVWLLNPVIWYNSAVWGQTDSVVNALGFFSVFLLLKQRLQWSMVFLTLSLLFKGSLAIFIPVIIFYAALQRYKLSTWVKSFFYSGIVVILISVWFHPQPDLLQWLFELYSKRFIPGEIGYLTANAFNFWWLVDSGKMLDSTLYLGFPARVWGILILLGVNLLAVLRLKNRAENRLWLALMVVSLTSFLFMTRIHERYLYPFFPVATIFVGLFPGFLVAYTTLVAVHWLNLYHLFWAPPAPWLESLYLNHQFSRMISFMTILVWVSVFSYLWKKGEN